MLRKTVLACAAAAALLAAPLMPARADVATGGSTWLLVVTITDTSPAYRDTIIITGFNGSAACSTAASSTYWSNWNTGTRSYFAVCVPPNNP